MWFDDEQLRSQRFGDVANEEGSFDWNVEMDRDASVPASNLNLFPHVEFTQRRYAEFILYPGRTIWYRDEDGKVVSGTVRVVCGRSVVLDAPSENLVCDLGDIVRDIQHNDTCSSGEIKGISIRNENLRDLARSENSPTFPVADLSEAEFRDMWLPVADIPKVGQYFELQDIRNPFEVHVAKITENRGGLLKVVYENGRDEKVFVTSERCHEMEWTLKTEQECEYATGAGCLLKEAIGNAVPSFLFSQNPIEEHNFEVGMALEVLDASDGGVFYPGYVCAVLNSRYFRVRISQTLFGPVRELLCHRSHPYIFPVYWCENSCLHLTPPQDWTQFINEKFTWNLYCEKCATVSGCAPQCLFDLRASNPCAFERRRNIEVLDIRTKNTMYPAKIVRSIGHLVWAHLAHNVNATPPAVFSTRSQILFPCGFAKRYGIHIEKSADYDSIESTANEHRLDPDSTYTCQRTPVFVPPKKRFLPSLWLQGDLWVPTVYVRKGCFAGPLVDSDVFRQIPDRYSSGPLPSISRAILRDIIRCANYPRGVCRVLSCPNDSLLPTISVKVCVKQTRYRVRVECCERASEFCGWLRSICILLDACPNLYSIRDSPCESHCDALRSRQPVDTLAHVSAAHLRNGGHKLVIPRWMRRGVHSASGGAHRAKPKDNKHNVSVQAEKSSNPGRPLTRAFSKKFRSQSGAPSAKTKRLEVKEDNMVGTSVRVDDGAPELVILTPPPSESSPSSPPPQNLEDEITTSMEYQGVVTNTMLREEVGLTSWIQRNDIASFSWAFPYKRNMESPMKKVSNFPKVTRNPMLWTTTELARWIRKTEFAPLSDDLKKQKVDGKAFMMLRVNDCIHFLNLKFGPALKLCALSNKLKSVYERRFSHKKI